MEKIPYARQLISEKDIEAVVKALKSEMLTQGAGVLEFERAISHFTGASYAAAMCNATAALHLSCLALGLGDGDILWTSPNSFVASANCALYCGATVDFVDIDKRTYNICVEALEEKLVAARSQNKLPKILVAVHFSGQPCDMRRIRKLSREFGFFVIEDASHAIGSKFAGGMTGNCEFSDITVFSFHPVKIITTGEGGLALTNDSKIHRSLLKLRSHGITRDPTEMSGASEGDWYYQQVELGYNYRITDFQCALGLSQLERLPEFMRTRSAIAAEYNAKLSDLPLILPHVMSEVESANHLYVVQVDSNRTSKFRKEVFDAMREAGIAVNVHYIPIHLQPFYTTLGFRKGQFPVAELYYSRAISLPMYAGLAPNQQNYVIETLSKLLDQ